MKTLLKKLYILSITLIMTITIMPISNFNSFAESEWVQADSCCWEIIENGIRYTTNPKAENQTVYAQSIEAAVKDVVIPESVNGLPVTDICIEDNETIQTLKIPSSVTFVRMFNCPNMTEVNVDENNEKFYSIDGVMYDKACNALIYYPPSREAETFRIPDGIKFIGYTEEEYQETMPFESCKYLENIIFPESLEHICEKAFVKCNFEYIEITGNTSIGKYAFADNKKLKEIVFSENFLGSSSHAFMGCDAIETVVFLRKEPFKDRYCSDSAVPIIGDSFWYANLFDLTFKTAYVPDNIVENYEYALGSTGFHNFVPLSERPKGDAGDINNNGKTDIMDIVDLQKFLTRKRSVTGLNADINEDGQINVFDFMILKKMVLNSDK